jgi:hypothetical protein
VCVLKTSTTLRHLDSWTISRCIFSGQLSIMRLEIIRLPVDHSTGSLLADSRLLLPDAELYPETMSLFQTNHPWKAQLRL